MEKPFVFFTCFFAFYTHVVGTTVVKKRGDYEIDVTALLKEMIANKGRETAKYSVQNSFLIRCDTPGGNLLLASDDNGLFSPCLEILLEK